MRILIFLLLFILYSISCFGLEYKRSLFGHGWINNTREKVLSDESLVGIRINENGKVTFGVWLCGYTGSFITDPRSLDIDHVVSLKEAFVSGADKWTPEKRIEYANYLGYKNHLIAVTASSNRSKGAKDISEWLPLIYVKEYLIDWKTIKDHWGLCYDKKEVEIFKQYNMTVDNPCEE
jgi:hypothetical protein